MAWEGELIRGRFGATPSPLPAVNLVIIPSALTLFLYLECCIVVVFGFSNHSFLLQGMGKVALVVDVLHVEDAAKIPMEDT